MSSKEEQKKSAPAKAPEPKAVAVKSPPKSGEKHSHKKFDKFRKGNK